MSQNDFWNYRKKYKPVKVREAFLLFETVVAIMVFMSAIIGILSVVNFSNKSFRRSLDQFNARCSVTDFYHQNITKATHTGDTIYFDGVAFYKVVVETDMGTKYVFFKK